MDSAGHDSDDEVIISESSASEDSFTDFSGNIVLNKAHSTLRFSTAGDLIEDIVTSEEDEATGSIIVSEEESGISRNQSVTIDDTSIIKVRKPPTSKRRGLRIVSSDEESISEENTESSRDSSGTGSEHNRSVAESSQADVKLIRADSERSSEGKKATISLKELEESLGKVSVSEVTVLNSYTEASTKVIEAKNSFEKHPELGTSLDLKQPEENLREIADTPTSGRKSGSKTSFKAKEVPLLKLSERNSCAKASAGEKEVEDSLDYVTVVDTSYSQDYADVLTHLGTFSRNSVHMSVPAGKELHSSSATSTATPLRRKLAEASRASYRNIDVSDSNSSSDEKPSTGFESDEFTENNSVPEVVEINSKEGVQEANTAEKVGSFSGKGISGQSKKQSLPGTDISENLPKETGEIWKPTGFQAAGKFFKPQVKQPLSEKMSLPEVKEIKTEFKKPKGNRKLPTERQLRTEIDSLHKDVTKLRATLMSVDVSKLPDQGMRLRMKLVESEKMLKEKEKAFAEKAFVEDGVAEAQERVVVKPPAPHRLPVGFGMQALKTQIREKTLTEEALHRLHGSINSCPAENVFADDPRSLRSTVQLMPHQKHALAWLMWRETQKPSAGILADDMGLGKTLTMISLILKCKEDGMDEEDDDAAKDQGSDGDDNDDEDEVAGNYWSSKNKKKRARGGTLVVCPASLIMQWEAEIKKHCKRDVLTVEIHHGSKREDIASRLARNDIVITTYSIVRNSGAKADRGVLHQIIWRRIILDEAHIVRNHKSLQSIAVCSLRGKRRWALTGTPVHNKELDLYALMKFLRVSPFDDYNVWHRWVDSKNAAGLQRLNTVILAIMLRRTKETLQTKGELQSLPDKTMQEFPLRLTEEEFKVYSKVLVFSKTLFAQFLHQRTEKENLMNGNFFSAYSSARKKFQVDEKLIQTHPELAHMFKKMTQMKDIKTHQILVLLLRLRQICCHPGLIKAMLDNETKEMDGIDDQDGLDIDILAQFRGMSLKDSSQENNDAKEDEDQMNVLTSSNPVFDLKRISSKMQKVFDVLEEKVLHTDDKAVIVSQWTSMLNIMYDHLKERGVKCDILSGAVKVADRMDIVNKFNREGKGFKVLLLSLTAGGVGLNLIGGNHLFMLDLHWNPQLECQAFDRVYRVGQKKNVFVYKFVCEETIEQRIKALQETKLALASSVLSGSIKKSSSKLTLQDLRSLFSM